MQVISLLLLLPFVLATPKPSFSSTTPVLNSRTITNYTIRNFSRDCTNSHICTYNLTIDTGESKIVCIVIDETPVIESRAELGERTGPLATTHAFYGKRCLEDDRWELSWGWDYQGDFTVLTVKHVPNSRQAYFGYKSPNVGLPVVKYADNGPNPIQSKIRKAT